MNGCSVAQASTHTNFKNLGPVSLEKIASVVNAIIYKNGQKIESLPSEILVHDVKTLINATDRDITFFSNSKYIEDFRITRALACVISHKYATQAPSNVYVLAVDDPHVAHAKVLALFYDPDAEINVIDDRNSAYIDKSASVSSNCKIGHGSYIGANVVIGNNTKIFPGAYIGNNVRIGNNCVIHHSVSIAHAVIGNNTIIHSGTRIGQDGFGFATEQGKHIKVPQIGRVVIGNDVEIGANCTIDRGSLEDTVIGDMCKLDNLIQIGHNVILDHGCIVVSQVGISGSTKVGRYVVLGGQVGVAGHLSIGDFAQAAAQAGITKSVKPNEVVFGHPARPIKEALKQIATLRKLSIVYEK